jgi:hypothetical protein
MCCNSIYHGINLFSMICINIDCKVINIVLYLSQKNETIQILLSLLQSNSVGFYSTIPVTFDIMEADIELC